MYKTHNSPNEFYRSQSPASENVCVPAQALPLERVFIDALQGRLVQTIDMKYQSSDVDVTHASVDTRLLNLKHMTTAQINSLFPTDVEPSSAPISPPAAE